MFRQRCPLTACPTGQIVDPVTLACVAAVAVPPCAHRGSAFAADLWLLGFGALCIALGGLLSFAWMRSSDDRYDGLGFSPDIDVDGSSSDIQLRTSREQERSLKMKCIRWFGPLFGTHNGQTNKRNKDSLLMD